MKYLLRVAPPLAAVAVLGFLLSAASSAADKTAADRTAADKDHAAAGHALEGRIQNVSATKHEITLTNVRPSPAEKSTGTTDRGATSDRPASTDTGAASTDRNRTAAGDNDKGTGTGTGAHKGTVMVQVAENAKITLDGKPAELSDLKADMYARVYLHGGAKTTGTDRGAATDRPASTDTGAASTDRNRTAAGDNDKGAGAGAGAHMTTDRIDAHTKGPAESGRQTETKDK